MTREQMLAYDRRCCPDSRLKPYLQWLSTQRINWISTQSTMGSPRTGSEAGFDQWLDRLTPHFDAFTCECHVKLSTGRR
jgi:hypothetical protein